MRVQLSRRPADEAGAVTVVVVLMLSTVLLGLAAFTADLGVAYVSARQTQNAADAAALAAGRELARGLHRCAAFDPPTAQTAGYVDAAIQAADEVREANLPGSDPVALTGDPALATQVRCRGINAAATRIFLEVDVWAAGETRLIFGGLLGRTDPIESLSKATARVEVADVALHVRPHALCGYQWDNTSPAYVPSWAPSTGMVTLRFPPDATAAPPDGGPLPDTEPEAAPLCPAPAAGPWTQGWWSMQCPGGGADSKALGAATRDGCQQPVAIVGTQPGGANPDPGQLSTRLLGACTSGLPTCQPASKGRVSYADVASEWPALVGETIVLPVFCTEAACNPTAVQVDGTPAVASGAALVAAGELDSNTRYPVWHLAAVTVCGYRWGDYSSNSDRAEDVNAKGIAAQVPECAGADSTLGGPDDYYLQVVPSTVVTTARRATTCAFGRPCDGGVRTVRLVE